MNLYRNFKKIKEGVKKMHYCNFDTSLRYKIKL